MTRANGHASWQEALDFAEQPASARPGHLGKCMECETQIRSAREFTRTLRFASSLSSDPVWADRTWDKILEGVGSPEWTALEADVRWARDEANRLSDRTREVESTSALREIGRAIVDGPDRLISAAGRALRTVTAVLLADSWSDVATGVRGTSTAAPRILVYETEAYTVSLSFQPGPDPEKVELDVLGQLTPRRGTDLPPGSTASLRLEKGSEIIVSVDQFGEFRFDALSQHPRKLLLTVGQDHIEMGPLPDLTAFN